MYAWLVFWSFLVQIIFFPESTPTKKKKEKEETIYV